MKKSVLYALKDLRNETKKENVSSHPSKPIFDVKGAKLSKAKRAGIKTENLFKRKPTGIIVMADNEEEETKL